MPTGEHVDFRAGLTIDDASSGLALDVVGPALNDALAKVTQHDGTASQQATLVISQSDDLSAESYKLNLVPQSDGSPPLMSVVGGGEAGLLYGLQTLVKLILASSFPGRIPSGTIEDAPLRGVRGVCVDAGRRYWQLETLYQLVESLAWQGMNRLQLHLTEWNGFRIRLADPRFAGLAAADSYSSADLNALIGFARRRQVKVSVELNLPAHCTALIQGMMTSGVDARFPSSDEILNDGTEWTGSPTASWLLNVTNPEVRAFIKELVAAFAREVDADSYHLGGDEWFGPQELANSPALEAYAAELSAARSLVGLQPADVIVDFLNELAAPLLEKGSKVELWNWWEQFPRHENTIAPDPRIVITAWPEDPGEARVLAEAGYRVIASPATTHYVTPRTTPGNRPATNYVAVDSYRINETIPEIADLHGEQLCIWADWAEDQDDEYFAWYAAPALAILASRLWSGAIDITVDDIVTAAFRCRPSLVNAPVTPGTSSLRIRPTVNGRPHSEAGKWLPNVASRLDNLMDARVQLRRNDGGWQEVQRIRWQPLNTWNVVWFDVPEGCRPAPGRLVDSRNQPIPNTITDLEWTLMKVESHA